MGFSLIGFDYFSMVCEKRKVGSNNQMFNMTTLEDNEYVPIRGGRKSKSLVSELVKVQKSLKKEVKSLTIVVYLKDIKIIALNPTSANGGEVGTD